MRPAVLRQYYGANVDVINESKHFIKRYTYGYGSGTSSVGIDPFNFVTRKMTKEMEYIGTELHEILSKNQKFLNLESADLSQKFNHCTVIMYYTGANLKQNYLDLSTQHQKGNTRTNKACPYPFDLCDYVANLIYKPTVNYAKRYGNSENFEMPVGLDARTAA